MANGTQQRNGESNALGIAGFVVSLVGLLSCGMLSPIGLIMSLVALGRPPKGLAIAGVVLGAVGSCGILSMFLFFPVVIAAMAAALGLGAIAAAVGGPAIEAKVDMAALTVQIEMYKDQHGGQLPPTLAEGTTGLDADSHFRTDRWGQPYVYQVTPDGRDFVIFSIGKDGVAGTMDDIFLDNQERQKQSSSAPSTPSAPADSSDSDNDTDGASQ